MTGTDPRLELIADTVSRLHREKQLVHWDIKESREREWEEAKVIAAKEPTAVVPRF